MRSAVLILNKPEQASQRKEGKVKSPVMMVMVMTIIMMIIQSCEEVRERTQRGNIVQIAGTSNEKKIGILQ